MLEGFQIIVKRRITCRIKGIERDYIIAADHIILNLPGAGFFPPGL